MDELQRARERAAAAYERPWRVERTLTFAAPSSKGLIERLVSAGVPRLNAKELVGTLDRLGYFSSDAERARIQKDILEQEQQVTIIKGLHDQISKLVESGQSHAQALTVVTRKAMGMNSEMTFAKRTPEQEVERARRRSRTSWPRRNRPERTPSRSCSGSSRPRR